MIWLVFLGGGIYSVSLASLGFLAGWYIKGRLKTEQASTSHQMKTGTSMPEVRSDKPAGGALKAMSPLERSLEDSKEIRERVNYLLK